MFCAFEGKPLILRLYGTVKIYHSYDPEWDTLIRNFPEIAGSRQIFEIDIDLVQTSCGMAVPFFEYSDDRSELENWAQKQGDERLVQYRKLKNTVSMDGFETNVIKE